MKLSKDKIDICMARKNLTVKELSSVYGVSSARINTILKSKVVTPACAGRVAKALDVDVTEIID